MKKSFKTSQIAVLLFLILCMMGASTEKYSRSAKDKTSISTTKDIEQKNNSSAIAGAWYLVYSERDGKERREDEPFQIKIFTEKHFSYLMKSRSGEWKSGSAGTYKTNGNIYVEKHLHSTNPSTMGLTVEWQYEVKGDTLLMQGPLKVTNRDGVEKPEYIESYNTLKEIRMRAK